MFKSVKLIRPSLSGALFKNEAVWRNYGIKTLSNPSTTATETQSASAGDTSSTIIVEKDANITLIGINREHARNSIDENTALQLCKAIYEFEKDKTSPVAVLYGVGGSFCTGSDMKELEEHVESGIYDFLLKQEGALGPTRRHLKKPIICGISGYCVGNGLELALLCDLRVMENTAILGFFNRSCGMPITDGGSVRLPAIIGYSRALDLILSGRRVGGKEALDIGLVNRLVATGSALGQAVNLAFCIAKFPMASLQHDRKSLYENVYNRQNFRTCTRNEISDISEDILREMQEGVQRFKNSKIKGARTFAWQVKPKPIPDWEREEIAYEEKAAARRESESKINSKFKF